MRGTLEHDDVEDVRKMARGDADALGRVYDRHAGALLGVAVQMVGERREAEDLVHDVFLEAYRRAADYADERGSVRAWLLVRLRSRAYDRLRTRGARGRAEDGGAPLHSSSTPDPGMRIDGQRALAALSRLPDDQRRIVVLAYFEGLSCSEIAERERMPIGTVKSRAFAAMAKLRKELGAER